MKKYILVFATIIAACFVNAQNNSKIIASSINVGVYKISNNQDSSRIMIEVPKKNKIFMEFYGKDKINTRNIDTRNFLRIPRGKLNNLIETLTYLKDKSNEWNNVLEQRKVYECEKYFSKVSLPATELFVETPTDTFHLYSRHYLKNVRFVKSGTNDNYKIVFNICGSLSINPELAQTLFINDDLELDDNEIYILISLLKDAAKSCETTDDILLE